MSTLEETLQCPQCGCMNINGAAEAEIQIDKLEAESAGRMMRIKKLVALCYEYDIPMNEVLDTGLLEADDEADSPVS